MQLELAASPALRVVIRVTDAAGKQSADAAAPSTPSNLSAAGDADRTASIGQKQQKQRKTKPLSKQPPLKKHRLPQKKHRPKKRPLKRPPPKPARTTKD